MNFNKFYDEAYFSHACLRYDALRFEFDALTAEQFLSLITIKYESGYLIGRQLSYMA